MLRWLFRLTYVMATMVLLYLGAAVIGAILPGDKQRSLPDGEDVEIGLLYGDIHVDIVLPADPQSRQALGFAESAGVPVSHPQAGYFAVGWGARDFYTQTPTWSHLRPRPILRAVTGDASVLRIEAFPATVPFDTLPRLRLSQAQYQALLDAISGSVPPGAPRPVATPFPRAGAGFVQAEGRFHILRTCNTWTGSMLRAAGLPLGRWTPTPFSLRLSLRWAGRGAG